jgi:epoxyqueuosine reductase
MSLTAELRSFAKQEGFALVGTCPAATPGGIHRLYDWLQRGYAGQMTYIERRRTAYEHPKHVLEGARSLLVLGMCYADSTPPTPAEGSGRVSNYAWGTVDYHDLIHGRLDRICSWIRDRAPGSKSRGVVDTAPLLEREFGQLAGLGWIGKNTMLINRSIGSYFFLAVVLTDLELEYDELIESDHCGSCTACLDACPTSAFPEPGVLDATRCISYLTIEHRSLIPDEQQSGIGDWLFGCDICQAVCPWNRRSPAPSEDAFRPRHDLNPVDLSALFSMSDDTFRACFRSTPLWRAKRRQVLRNAAIILANQRASDAVPALSKGMQDSDPVVSETCRQSLARLSTSGAD